MMDGKLHHSLFIDLMRFINPFLMLYNQFSKIKCLYVSFLYCRYGPPQAQGGGASARGGDTKEVTSNDAIAYLTEIKSTFQDRRDKYDAFLDVMKAFKAQMYIVFY